MKKRGPRDQGSSAERQPSDADQAEGVMHWVERKPSQSSATGPPAGSEPAVPVSGRDRNPKRRGRLSRAVLAMLGKGLEDCFDEVRRQEVPERFKLLLQQF
jgi:hypothetical protein